MIFKRSQKYQQSKNVKQMVKDYEENIFQQPLKFQDNYKPILAPREFIIQLPLEFQDNYKTVPKPISIEPVPYQRTKNSN